MALLVHNTLSGEKEEFRPIEEGKVRMYVCGVTVYDHSHMGHARALVNFDVIRRYLEYRGNDVRYVVNFTDVDDRIIARANEEGVPTICANASAGYAERAAGATALAIDTVVLVIRADGEPYFTRPTRGAHGRHERRTRYGLLDR